MAPCAHGSRPRAHARSLPRSGDAPLHRSRAWQAPLAREAVTSTRCADAVARALHPPATQHCAAARPIPSFSSRLATSEGGALLCREVDDVGDAKEAWAAGSVVNAFVADYVENRGRRPTAGVQPLSRACVFVGLGLAGAVGQRLTRAS